jgi:hypothetical protein
MRLVGFVIGVAAALSAAAQVLAQQPAFEGTMLGQPAMLGPAPQFTSYRPPLLEPLPAVNSTGLTVTAPAASYPAEPPNPPPNISLAPPSVAFDRAASDCCPRPCDGRSNSFCGSCDPCPWYGVAIFVGYDAFRGVSDDSWENNGIHTGVNLGTSLGPISELTGIGFQVGGSAAAYDWSGTDYRPRSTDAEAQGFLTYGFFRRPNADCAVTGAVVNDWMYNDNFGVYSQNPTLSQWRAQLGYAISAKNEFGVWGTWRMNTDTRNDPVGGQLQWRAVNQLAGYWHHKWKPGGADTTLYVGAPDQSRLGGAGSLGSWLVTAAANAPLNDRIALYTFITYMSPSAAAGALGSEEEAWNFSIGVAWYPHRLARSNTVAGRCWMPLMPVANNGFFMVDTNNH